MFCIVPFRRLYSYNNKAKITNFFGFYHRPFKKKFYIFSNLTCGPPKPNNDMKPHATQPVETNPEQYKRAYF